MITNDEYQSAHDLLLELDEVLLTIERMHLEAQKASKENWKSLAKGNINQLTYNADKELIRRFTSKCQYFKLKTIDNRIKLLTLLEDY